MVIQCVSLIFLLFLTIYTQAEIESNSIEESAIQRLKLENELRNGAELLREILEKQNNQYRDLDRLNSEQYRAKRCRWKLCGTGRRFRFF